MKQYALVKDSITGDTYGVVIRSNGSETCLAVKEEAEAWADSFNDMETKSLEDNLPYGVKIGDFHGMTEAEEVIVHEMALTKQDLRLPNRDILTLVKSVKFNGTSDLAVIKDAPIAFFEDSETAVEYKVRAFIADMARGSVLAKVRSANLGIEQKGMTFKSRKDNDFLREDLSQMALGYGALRRAAKDVLNEKQYILDSHEGYSLDEEIELHVKALGPKLGGGLRAAPRGMAFVDITGRVDGDRDGIVFEGVTGMERPIIPRFVVPQGMARRVSRALEGDSMEIEKRRRSGERDLGIDQATLTQRLGNDARFLQDYNGGGAQSRRAARREGLQPVDRPTTYGGGAEFLKPKRGRRRTEDYPRMDPNTVDRLRAMRFVPETSRSGRSRQNRIINTPAADGGPPRRAVRERSGRVVPEPPARDSRGGMRSERSSRRTDWQELTGNRGFYLNDENMKPISRREDEFGRVEEIYQNRETGKFSGRQSGFSDYDTTGIPIFDRETRAREFDTAEEVQRIAELDSANQFSGMRSQRSTGDDIRSTLSRVDQAEGGYARIDDDTFSNIRFAADFLDDNTDANSEDAFEFLLAALNGVRNNKDIKPKDRRELEKQINDALRKHSRQMPLMGGMRSRRGQNDDGSVPEGDFVDIDLTMEEVGYLSDIVDSIRDDIAAANDSEADELWQEFSDAIEDAAAGVDVVRLDRADAERLREMLEDIYDAEIQQGNPSPEEGDVLDLLGRAIDSPDGTWVSPSIEDNGGTRLSVGDGMRSWRGVRDRDQAAEMAGISREQFDEVEDFVSSIDVEGEIPGEIEGGISRGEDLGKRTSWGARVSSNSDAREGYLEDGPLKGSRWELISERVEAASTFNDPGETLSGRDYLQIDTPDGVRLEFESESWEDPMYFDRAIQISGGGMRSGRSGGGPDTRNSLADDPKYGTKVPSSMKDVRNDLAMLAANGWVWEERGANIYFAYPDRMYEWAKSQPDSWRRGFGESLMRGGVIPRHFGVHPRGAKKGDNTQVIKEMKKRVNAIFGPDAWSDMQKNAKNNGVGKIGNVPSVVPAGGMTSGRGRLRSAQDEITGAAGLGGGMRARRFGGGRNGIKKVNDRDGSIMDQLSDDQKKQMVEAALEREGQLFWSITQGGLFRALRNTMEDDGRYEGMSLEERKKVPIDNDLIPRMQKMLDDALRDGEVNEAAYARFQRQIDDIKTLNNMRERGNHDLLEHLHESSRKEIVKKARAKDNTIPTLAKLGGGGESTFYNDEAYASAQGVGKTTAERAAKRRGKKRIPLFDRLLDPDPNRAQRRANRRARRRGLTGGRRAADVNLADTVRLRRRIARQLRRARRRLRGERNEKSIREALANKRSTHPLKRDSLGRPVVDKAFVAHMAELGRLKADRDRGERSKETADDFLRDLWENGNMNELPELLSEDEVQALLDAGWKPVFRGVGPRETQNQYTDAYKEDRDARFISDPNRRAYGTGEYWAPEGSGHWGGYGRGMVGFVDPDGRKISGRDIEDIKQKHSALRKEMSALMAELGDGVLKGEDPANAVSQMRARIKEAEDRLGVAGMLENEMGQIYSQWLDYYGGLSADSPDRDAAWSSFEYMQDLTRLDSGYYAAFLGYDYVTHGGVTLVHNRGTVAVADVSRAISADEATELLKKGKDGDGVTFPS